MRYGRAMNRAVPFALLVAVACTAHAAPAKNRRGPDRIDAKSTAEIRRYTTDPSFLTEWVDHLPASRKVPSPPRFLGYVIGTPGRLTRPDKINAYFRALARASNRVRVFSMGRSHGGREMIVAAIADAGLLRRLDQVKRANRRLSDPRLTDESEAKNLAESTPPIYYITAGLHSPETGPPEMVMELAYRLAVSEQKHIREIRAGVITLITPVLEVDGRARMVDWYYRHLQNVEEFEDSPPRMAPYWGDYTAHDNNRDGLQMSQELTRNYVETFHEFLPVVSLDLHESVPLLYISTGTGPYNDTIDPITISEWQWMSSYEVSECTKLGLRGVWTWGFYTGWYPGYLLWVTNNHNAIGRFYETFGNTSPKTFERDLREAKYADKRLNARQWYRAWPPEKRLKWSLRNNTNYMQTGVLASLQLVARNGETLLYNFWKKGKNSLEKGKKEPPHGFVIAAEQRDRGNLHRLLTLLSEHRIEVDRATAAASHGTGRRQVKVAVGDYIVRMDQPYRNFAKTLLMKQSFPRGAEHTPYDDVAWSLDYMLGVTVKPIADPAVLSLATERLVTVPELPGKAGAGTRWIIDHRGQTALASLRWALGDVRASALKEPWRGHPVGSLVIESAAATAPGETDKLAEKMKQVTRRFHLDAVAIAERPQVAMVEVDLPRIALFHTWHYTQDSGWARYTLEDLEIPYTLINKDHLRAGGLKKKFDVIIVPSQGGSQFRDIVGGIDRKWGPLAYTKTAKFPSHGVIDSSPDITGGMGFLGLAHLETFVRDGGVLVALGSAGILASESGMAREVSAQRTAGTPGSHVTVKTLRPEHPLSWGYPARSHVFRQNLPVYDVRDYRRGLVVMQFGTKTWLDAEREADRRADIPVKEPDPATGKVAKKNFGPPLALSGLVKDPKVLARKPALLDVPLGRGRIVLYSWNPFHRHQNHHDFARVGNALLFYNDFPREVPTREQMEAREIPAKKP